MHIVYHEGTVQAYLSAVTGSLEDATGDGDWFKIGSIGWNGNGTTAQEIWTAYKRPYVSFSPYLLFYHCDKQVSMLKLWEF